MSEEINVIKEFQKKIKYDSEYRYGFFSNITMCFYDEARRSNIYIDDNVLLEISRKAADNFLRRFTED